MWFYSMVVSAVLTYLLAAPAPAAFAWGNDGHKIVCEIATKILSTDAATSQTIKTLLKTYAAPDGEHHKTLPVWCTFPDKARKQVQNHDPAWKHFADFSDWHFLNLSRTAHHVEATACHDDCVIEGIDFHRERLGRPTLSKTARAEALIFLAHWVGDIHQPLHISYKDDSGGNSIKPITGGVYTAEHMHGVWDTAIISKARGDLDWWTYADNLAKTIDAATRTSWEQADPTAWAEESYAITTEDDVEYCHWQDETCTKFGNGRSLDASYQTRFQPVVETRLKQAGVRLAFLIRTALAGTP